MLNKLEVDFREVLSGFGRQAFLTGEQVLGPKERFFGSLQHQIRRIDDHTILHIQNFIVEEPYDFIISKRNIITFQFTLRGNYQKHTGGKLDYIGPGAVSISNFPRSTSQMSVRGQNLYGTAIIIEREHLVEHYGLRIECVPAQFRPIFSSSIGLPFVMQIPLLASSWVAVEQILACTTPEPFRDAYIKAKSIELVCDIVAAINRKASLLRPYDASAGRLEKRMLEAAAAIYAREIETPPSVGQLAERVGLPRNRLTEGFREHFNDSPAAYARKLRLEWAIKLIRESNIPVVEVAVRSGYKNYAAFSRAFNAHFGHPPTFTGDDEQS